MANEGASPVDTTTLAGKVRILVGDTDATDVVAGQGTYAWYSDSELEALGEMFSGSPKRVAIWVLSQVGMSQALLLKKWTSEDLAVDGTAIMRGIEATLKRLSAEVEREEAMTGDEEYFGVEPWGDDYRVLLPHGTQWWWND